MSYRRLRGLALQGRNLAIAAYDAADPLRGCLDTLAGTMTAARGNPRGDDADLPPGGWLRCRPPPGSACWSRAPVR